MGLVDLSVPQPKANKAVVKLSWKAKRPLAYDVGSQKSAHQSATPASSEKSALTLRLRHVGGSVGVLGRLHRGTSRLVNQYARET
jgi:hypothetical protein